MRSQAGFLTICTLAAVGSAAAVLTLEPVRDRQHSAIDDAKLTERLPLAKSDALPVVEDEREIGDTGDAVEATIVAAATPDQPADWQSVLVDPSPTAPAPSAAPSTWSLESWTAETRPAKPQRAPETRSSASPVMRGPLKAKVPDNGTAVRTVTLKERLNEISPGANRRLVEKFLAANAQWPPAEIGLVAIKDQKVIELHARSSGGTWQLVHQYPVLAASGTTGPKLKQGDKQVPEGVYEISFLNPNSRYHVSLRVNYPNDFDRKMAEKDGRKELGGDIMIHGKAVSIGCLAIGDEAAEEIFVLADKTGLKNIKLIIAPTDFRRHGVPEPVAGQPAWVPKLYTEVASAMSPFKPPPSGLFALFGKW